MQRYPDITSLLTHETIQMIVWSPFGIAIAVGIAVGLAMRLKGKGD